MTLIDTIKADVQEAVRLLETIAEYPEEGSRPHVGKVKSILNRLEDNLSQHLEHSATQEITDLSENSAFSEISAGGEAPANA